ncbi:MAG: sterol desaturase family protein [Pseudomonadota bacterium]
MATMDFILNNEPVIRLSAFLGVMVIMVILQSLFPRKQTVAPALDRWRTNGLLVVLDSVFVRLLGPLAAVGVAAFASQNGLGLLSLLQAPLWFEVLVAVVLLDLAIYAQHVATHHIPMLWRFHQVHHADRDIDATTSVRFHPVEIIVSMLYKGLIVVALGPAVVAVILFEALLNGSAIFNHANVALPRWLDQILRLLIVTPDTHRVHHSVHGSEANRNFGFFLSVWDRLFRTYQAQPRDGHDDMLIGLPGPAKTRATAQPDALAWSLMAPFRPTQGTNEQPSDPSRLRG